MEKKQEDLKKTEDESKEPLKKPETKGLVLDFSESFGVGSNSAKGKKIRKPKLSKRKPRKPKPQKTAVSSKKIPKKPVRKLKFKPRRRWVSDFRHGEPKVLASWKLKENDKIIIKSVWGDLTKEKVDAICNAANGRLAHMGGVAGAVLRACGYGMQMECEKLILNHEHSRFNTPDCVKTSAGKLGKEGVKYVFHAVGPFYRNGKEGEKEKLEDTIRNVFKLVEETKIKSVAIPSISSGIFGYPKDKAIEIISRISVECAKKINGECEIRMTNIDKESTKLFIKEFEKYDELETIKIETEEVTDKKKLKKEKKKKDEDTDMK